MRPISAQNRFQLLHMAFRAHKPVVKLGQSTVRLKQRDPGDPALGPPTTKKRPPVIATDS